MAFTTRAARSRGIRPGSFLDWSERTTRSGITTRCPALSRPLQALPLACLTGVRAARLQWPPSPLQSWARRQSARSRGPRGPDEPLEQRTTWVKSATIEASGQPGRKFAEFLVRRRDKPGRCAPIPVPLSPRRPAKSDLFLLPLRQPSRRLAYRTPRPSAVTTKVSVSNVSHPLITAWRLT